MKWSMIEKVNTSDFWILEDGDTIIAELRFNIPAKSIRMNQNEKRLYFLEQTGFLRPRIQLKNEYNQVNGEIQFNKNANNGLMIISAKKYLFNFTGDAITISAPDLPASTISISSYHTPDAFEASALLFGYCNHM